MMMLIRYASAVTTSTFMTFALLFVMQLLISLQPPAQSETRVRHILGIWNMQHEDTPVQPRELIPPREELTKTELPPARPQYDSKAGPVGVRLTAPTPPPVGNELDHSGLYMDGPLVALVRVAPTYPVRASAQGLEGYVVVQFDVTTIGHVTNVLIVETSNSIFNKASIKAAERFKFKPRVVDGVALASYGMRNLFRFNMDDL
jgi:protein TonB